MLRGLQVYWKKALAQVFSCEFCEIFKNIFSYRTPLVNCLVPFYTPWKQKTRGFLMISRDIESETFKTSFEKLQSCSQKFVTFGLDAMSLNLLWQRFLSYSNQSIDLQRKPIDWFLYERDLRQERVKELRKRQVLLPRILINKIVVNVNSKGF